MPEAEADYVIVGAGVLGAVITYGALLLPGMRELERRPGPAPGAGLEAGVRA